MKNYIIPCLVLAFSLPASATPSASSSPYIGVAASWDHMSGSRKETLTNFDGQRLDFSKGKSLSSNQMNGYIFFGVAFKLPQSCWFIAPEFQIGQGTLNSQIKTTVADDDLNVGGVTPLQRRLDPKLSRNFNTSLIARVGRTITPTIQVYTLAGIDASRFKYSYVHENVDFATAEVNGSTTFSKAKWKAAPVIGVGIEKKIDKLTVGLDYRVAFYGSIKTSKTYTTGFDSETVVTKVKPQISSVMLRFAYSL